ncbi:hypothetical protein RU97_GL001198 [Enterococcus canis]|uniref:HTH lysR-type domain-containing protein n=1 Tax=Enterococcus canis TaxID=214095 RepID=A0A1L8RIP3_9ENTE|nr:hypothetical protein RU97_GL001198 [Enterococcus canis]
MNITQPTLSRQIRELEESLGVQLLERHPQGLQLTQEGLFLKERAAEILLLDNKLEQSFARKGREMTGSLTIGCVEADNSDTVAMMLEEFLADYPQVTFELITGTGDLISNQLEKGILDVALLLEPITLKNVQSFVLPRREKWGLLVSTDSILAQRRHITPADISGLPLLISARKEVQQMLAEWAGLEAKELNTVGNFNLIFNVFSLVENWVGAALTIEGAVLNRQSLRTKFVPLEPEIGTQCRLVWKERIHTPVVKEFIQRFKLAFQA